jgi:hypothetical protein
MFRCASSFIIAAYLYVRLIPHDSRALPAERLRVCHETFEKWLRRRLKNLFRFRSAPITG